MLVSLRDLVSMAGGCLCLGGDFFVKVAGKIYPATKINWEILRETEQETCGRDGQIICRTKLSLLVTVLDSDIQVRRTVLV